MCVCVYLARFAHLLPHATMFVCVSVFVYLLVCVLAPDKLESAIPLNYEKKRQLLLLVMA